MYVAYRKGDKVYWTRKKVALHPGETLISDGKNCGAHPVRQSRGCGPLGPPAIMDPLEADFNQPLFSNDMVTDAVEPQPESLHDSSFRARHPTRAMPCCPRRAANG